MSQAHEAMLDAALRALTATTGPAVLPLRAARLTDTAAELYLAGPTVLPSPWTSISPTVWQADYEHLPAPSPSPAPFPALCMLGQDQEQGHVLLELQHVRICRIAGDPSAVLEVLAGLVVEAAMSPWGEHLRLSLVGAFPDLESSLDSGRIDYFATPADFFAQDLQPGLTYLVVVGGAISDHSGAQLQALLDSHPHVCLLCTDADGLPDTAWTLQLGAEGAADLAELQPLGVRVWPRRLPWQTYAHLLAVVDEPHLATAPRGDAAFMPPLTDVQTSPWEDQAGPQVLMLGPVHLDGVTDRVEPTRRARLSELAAYLVLHPGASAGQLDEAIWPERSGEDNGNTRNTTISKLRRWVGEDPDGHPWLPKSEAGRAGRYGFTSAVGSDIDQWQALIGDNPAAVSTRALEKAYGLLRGVPFEGTPARRYAWAEPVRQAMSAQIAEVCAELGERHLAAGRWRDAATVASFGQRTALGCERLWRIRIKAAALSGLPRELAEVESQLRDMQDRLGTDLEPPTEAALEEARMACTVSEVAVPELPIVEQPAPETVPAVLSPVPEPEESETAEASGDPVVPQQVVQVLPTVAPARRRGAGVLAAVACVALVAVAGGVWIAVQPSTEAPTVAAPRPASPPVPQPDATPTGTAPAKATEIHPTVIPIGLKWGSAADWQRKKQLAAAAAEARAVPVPWNGIPSTSAAQPAAVGGSYVPAGNTTLSPTTPTTGGGSSRTPTSSGGVVIKPDTSSSGGGGGSSGLPDLPADPSNPDAP